MISDAKSKVDIKCRIAVTKNAFTELKAILRNLKMPVEIPNLDMLHYTNIAVWK